MQLVAFWYALELNCPFLIPELPFHVLRFGVWDVLVSSHSLVSLVLTMVGIFDTVSIFVCVVGVELCHDSCHGSCYGGLECSGIYLQNWCFAGVLVISMGRHDSFS